MSPHLKILSVPATYYPYGEPTIEPRGQRFLFGGKEREHAAGRNSYDFGARNLAANAWTTPDPLAEKFYPLSPYSYCGGDPINNIDPTGKIIEFADSSNVEFIQAFNEAVSYLREYGASKWVDNIINSKKVYTLVAEPKHNYIEESKAGYSRVTIGSNGDIKRELIWDYSIVIETETDYFISPAETLSHEADHLYRSEIDLEGQQKDNSTYDEQYGNLEDRRVIQGSEQIVAHKLKRLPAGQSTRFSHGMRLKHKAKDVRGGYIDNPGLIVTSKKQKKMTYYNRVIFSLAFGMAIYINSLAIPPIKEVSSWKIGNVDSMKIFMPEYNGIHVFGSQTRSVFLSELKKSDISPRLLYNTSDKELISKIRDAVNKAPIKCKLPFDVSEFVLEAFVSPDLNKYPPGMYWRSQDKASVRGCAVIYGDEDPILLWFGLGFVDINDLRLDCNLSELININRDTE